jgi:hypothetical protein
MVWPSCPPATLYNNSDTVSPNYPAWLAAYGNRRNVNDGASFLDPCLRCWCLGGFTDRVIVGLGAIHGEREGEYEGYCITAVVKYCMLMWLQQFPIFYSSKVRVKN